MTLFFQLIRIPCKLNKPCLVVDRFFAANCKGEVTISALAVGSCGHPQDLQDVKTVQ